MRWIVSALVVVSALASFEGRALADDPPAPPPPASPAAPAPKEVATPKPTGASSAAMNALPPHPLNELVSLQFDDAEIGDLVRVVGTVTGKRFVIASSRMAKVRASIYAPQKVTATEAYQALLAVLQANGMTVVPQGGFYRIVDSADIARQAPIDRGPEASPEERYFTRIHRLEHLGAEEVATGVLSKLATKDASIVPYAPGNLLIITETGANMRRMMSVLDQIDRPGTDAKLYFQPILHVASATVEKELTSILGIDKKGDGKEPAGGELYVGRVAAIDKPNALVIVSSPTSYLRILELLQRIDVAEQGELQVHVVPLQYADAKKIVGPIAESIGGSVGVSSSGNRPGATGAGGGAQTGGASMSQTSILEAPAKVSADETTNSLIVTASPRDFVNIKEVIAALDKPKRQVFIEAVIMDLSADTGLDLGVSWHGGNVDSTNSGNVTEFGGFRAANSVLPPSTTDLQAFALGIRGPEIPFNTGIPGLTSIPSVGAFLTAAATSKGTDILSTPSITASDNTPAEIKVQLNESLQPHAPQPAQYLTGQIPGALPGASSGVTANYKPIGPRVKITPHLNDSDDVRLDIEEVISDVASEPSAADTYGTVSYIERSATTTMTVKDGSTAVIGGLVRNVVRRTENKIPILGDIPILGFAFRTRSDATEKSNLVLVLTPYIIRGEDDMRRVIEKKRQERQELIDHAAIFSANTKWKPPVDYKKRHGVLVEMAHESRRIDKQREELANVSPRNDGPPLAQRPMELPVSLPTQGGQRPATSTPTAPASTPTPPAAPTIQVRSVER